MVYSKIPCSAITERQPETPYTSHKLLMSGCCEYGKSRFGCGMDCMSYDQLSILRLPNWTSDFQDMHVGSKTAHPLRILAPEW